MEKLFVNVRCDHHKDGTLRPRQILWSDGRTWDIKRTLHVAEPVEDEFEGIRYTVLIGSAEKEEKAISRMAAQIGVSYTAMLIRLKQFRLLDYHPAEEYFEKTLHGRKA